jgi:hypothetical protein
MPSHWTGEGKNAGGEREKWGVVAEAAGRSGEREGKGRREKKDTTDVNERAGEDGARCTPSRGSQGG